MAINVAINGFGRIGKTFLRAVLQNSDATKKINIVAINLGPSSPANLAEFFTYDSVYGTYRGTVQNGEKKLIVDGLEIEIFTETDPLALPWKKLNVDWVIEASGQFTNKEKASLHLQAGCKKVLITAPSKDEDITIIPGVNNSSFDPTSHHIVSLGSCTTNCFAPIIKVLNEKFQLTQGIMTTIHAYTNNQALLDSEHKDPRRGRAAAVNIIPTSTGADKVITKIYPELLGKLQGVAIRVPVPCGSLVDFTFNTSQKLSAEAVNQAFQDAATGELKNILYYCTSPLVSSDFVGSPHSCVIDSLMTRVSDNGMIGKVFGWYDNEFGYSSRLKDFLLHNC